jgi:hypothetical protein
MTETTQIPTAITFIVVEVKRWRCHGGILVGLKRRRPNKTRMHTMFMFTNAWECDENQILFWIPTGHILQIRFKHDGGKLIEKEIAGYR